MHADDAIIADIMEDRVVSVLVTEDQEEVAHKIRDYNFLAVPVVDEDKPICWGLLQLMILLMLWMKRHRMITLN